MRRAKGGNGPGRKKQGMARFYVAVLRQEEGTDIGVEFPDFPGCVTAGRDLDDAARMAQEALELHVEGLVEEGEVVPEPSSIEEIEAQGALEGGAALCVKIPDEQPATVRLNITMREDVVKQVDDYVRRVGGNRSAFLAAAALEKIREERKHAGG